MNVFWAEQAQQDYFDIAAYLLEHSPGQAEQVMGRIDAAAQSLADFPDRYRRGPKHRTREQIVRGLPYIITYHVAEDYIEIVALFHTARDFPRGG